ncbi:MAG: VOC family protein [Steroidobacteraceae bacterium]|nr:VOC family protein [Steroidobacteraceae bacterium]MDW8259359.1 hypothetical protein [Gammaproteobacteria bacterium]
MLGMFHEISIATRDIRASVDFYERLGFHQCITNDTWSHPYGVLTDGRVFLGLHQYQFASPSITYVHREVARLVPRLEALGIEMAFAKTSDDCFNEIGFRDPAGQMVTILEARTYSPPDDELRANAESRCGYFDEFSLPATDFAACAVFWERLGFVAMAIDEVPFVSQTLASDALDLALHRPQVCEQPMLVFRDPTMRERIAALRNDGLRFAGELPRGLDPERNGLLIAPEGTPLLLLHQD